VQELIIVLKNKSIQVFNETWRSKWWGKEGISKVAATIIAVL
jgi:hypothetical protein